MAITYKQSDLVGQVQMRVDDSPSSASVVEWINAGVNVMAMRVNAVFPMLSVTESTSKLPFDDKWSEIPVLYACARFKQSDLMTQDAQSYMNQFEMMVRDFVLRYEVPPQYKDDPNTEQFVPQLGQVNFTITKESFSAATGDLIVYKNNRKLVKDTDFTVTETGFSLALGAQATDFITAVWEYHSDLQEPPYSWWTNW
jgi:hypothetical protein